MKFSYQLAYNAYSPWSDKYIAYKKLKKMIKQQRREIGKSSVNENWNQLSKELVTQIDKLAKLSERCDSLCESEMLMSPESARNERMDGKRQKAYTEVHLELNELKKFIFLNAEGVRKIIKKFDKLNGTFQLNNFSENELNLNELIHSQKTVDACLDHLLVTFANAFTDGEVDAAEAWLSKSLTDLVEWEKGTIWNDMLKLERNRKRLAAKGQRSRGNDRTGDNNKSQSSLNSVAIDGTNAHMSFILGNFAVVAFASMAFAEAVPGLPFHAARCLSVLVLVSGWWSLGTLPLFVSALAVPLLVVAGDVLPGMNKATAAQSVLQHMWGSSQAMVLASFAMAAALSKLRLDKQLACVIMIFVKNGKRKIMFALMSIGWSASFSVGNMASSVLCLSLAAPVLDELPQLDPFTIDYGRRLLIGIAFACNIGGMTSPIASPQNIVAFAALHPFGVTFAQWAMVAVPSSFILLVATFLYLMPPTRPHKHSTRIALTDPLLSNSSDSINSSELPPRLVDSIKKKFIWDWRHISVCALSVFAAMLWMMSSVTTAVFGDVGLASLLPLLLLFALPGVLNKSDFLSMPWDVCLLLGSGGVLSAAVSQSRLLSIVGTSVESTLSGVNPQLCQVVCCLVVTVVSTCVSHTAAANVLMPFIVELGMSELGASSAVRFILPVSLCLSAGSALPVSSCPNMNATAIARSGDESIPWVHPNDYWKPGLVLSFITVIVMSTITYSLTAIICKI